MPRTRSTSRPGSTPRQATRTTSRTRSTRYAGKVVLIPLFDATCRDIPTSGLTQDCTDPGNGNNLYYHIPKFVAMLLDHAYIQGNNRPDCNGPPGIPIGGNGGTSCLKGWFVEYIIQGPVGEFDPNADNAQVLSIQLIQ